MTLQVVAVPRQWQKGWSECVQAPERAQMLPTCILLQIYLYSERLRIAMATPVTNWRIRAKTHKGSHFEGFSLFLSVFLIFSSSQESLLSRWAYSSFTMDPLYTPSSLFPQLGDAEKTQLLLESVRISGVCFPFTQIKNRTLAMTLPSPEALFSSVISWRGEVSNRWCCCSVWKQPPLLQPEKLWCIFCVPKC